MAPVPVWTREWRPLARQLCAHITTSNPTDKEDLSLLSKEKIFLRADRVVGQLYSHLFVDSVPQDVQAQTQALAMKFRVHSLEDRAEKLVQLSSKCDYQVLKLLLELATNPTTATDQEVAVDLDTKCRWQTVLQQEQHKLEQHNLLQEQLVEELFQISTNDEWYQAWEDSDEDDCNWDIGSADGLDIDSDRDNLDCHRKAKSSSNVLEEEHAKKQGSMLRKTSEQAARQEMERHEQLDISDDELVHNEILCRYYPENSTHVEEVKKDVDDSTIVLEIESMVPFTLERPWLLCETVIKSAECTATTENIAPLRLIHEETVVSMVFEALYGLDSLLFDFYPINPTPLIFSADFQTKVVKRSRYSQNVALGHLSPLTFHHVLDHFAEAASELQILRDFLHFLRERHNYNDQLRCVTLEGLANALFEVLKSLLDSVHDVEQQATILTKKDSRPWSGTTLRQPTLIGLLGGLKEIFKTVSWLKGVLEECFHGLSHRHWHEVKRAEQAKCVLDSLYHLMEEKFVEGVAADEIERKTDTISRSDALLHLYIGTLMPYLGLLNRMVFERGHFETILLEGELFFAKPVSIGICASPIHERNQTFRERIMLLAPFEVNQSLVPIFLESLASLINETLASRQLQNRYLLQQHASVEPLTKPKLAEPSLQEVLRNELEKRGCKRKCGIFSVFTEAVCNTEDYVLSPQQIMLKCSPFSRILENCLTAHVETKCQELNSEITDTFRNKMNYLDHVVALRMFVLMEQQDVLSKFSKNLIAHMQKNPVAWADSNKINAFHQSALQGDFEDNSLSSAKKKIGGRLCVKVDFDLLDSVTSDTRIDIATMKCLYFTFTLPQPLQLLFSESIMQKYSALGILIVQVKAVESALVKFNSTVRRRPSYPFIEKELRQRLLQIADMLHYTKTLLNYLSNQISSERWAKCHNMLRASQSLAVMDATHELYLDHLLNRFFLLDKHATVVQYIVTTFNHILRFVGQVDAFVGAVDQNLRQYFPDSSYNTEKSTQESFGKVASVSLLENPDFRILHSEMTQSSKEFKRQSHFLVVMLTAMQKHSPSPHVNAIVMQLNYNYFYHQKESRPQSNATPSLGATSS